MLSVQRQTIEYRQKLIHKFKNVLTQYFFILHFSEFKIEPKVKQIFGFDLVLSKCCVQFSTQVCRQPTIKTQQSKLQMKQNLRIMHALKIIHRDIKPQNVMFSPQYNRLVFIDFGCTTFLQQSIGLISKTQFKGTTNYCSQEMLQVFYGRQDQADLFYNDFHGLNKTISNMQHLTSKAKQMPYLSNKIQSNSIKQNGQMQIILKLLKFNIYQSNQDVCGQLWRILIINYKQHIPYIINYTYNFLSQIASNQQIQKVVQRMPYLKRYKNVQIDKMAEQGIVFNIYIEQSKCPIRKKQFIQYEKSYKVLEIISLPLDSLQRQYYLTLIYRELLSKSNFRKGKFCLSNLWWPPFFLFIMIISFFTYFLSYKPGYAKKKKTA